MLGGKSFQHYLLAADMTGLQMTKAAFIQEATGNGNAMATQWKLQLLKREWLVYSRQFTEVFILNQLQFAATEYDSIY